MSERLRIEHLLWDSWNLEHISKHHVHSEEVEEVVALNPVVRRTYKSRFQLLGPTLGGRVLSVIVGAVPDRPSVYYVFSARSASRNERVLYELLEGGAQ